MKKSAKLVDFDAFKAETGLEDGQVKELYNVLLDEISSESTKLYKWFECNEYERLAKSVHNIKGISGSYMLIRVFNSSSKLNAWLKEERTADIETGITELLDDIADTVIEIKNYFAIKGE